MTAVTQSGVIGTADITTPNVPVLVGQLGAAMTVQLLMLNRNLTGTAAKVQFAISTSAITPGNADWVDFGGPQGVPAKGSRDRGGIACGANEYIWAQSDTANISVRAGGVLLP